MAGVKGRSGGAREGSGRKPRTDVVRDRGGRIIHRGICPDCGGWKAAECMRCQSCARAYRRVLVPQRQCIHCGRAFQILGKLKNRFTCSEDCLRARQEAYALRLKKPRGVCEQCGKQLQKLARERYAARFCSRQCSGAFRTVQKVAAQTPRLCRDCGEPRQFHAYRCDACVEKRTNRRCVQCSAQIPPKLTGKTCSSQCRAALMGTLLRGKKYNRPKAEPKACEGCGEISPRKAALCARCARRELRQRRGGEKYRHRCRRAGVPYDPTVSALAVLTRDKWTCQLCRVRTPKRLRGTYHPNAPELDHIVAIGTPGGSPGHVWSNVQCACRKCNMSKSAKTKGQLRLAV